MDSPCSVRRRRSPCCFLSAVGRLLLWSSGPKAQKKWYFSSTVSFLTFAVWCADAELSVAAVSWVPGAASGSKIELPEGACAVFCCLLLKVYSNTVSANLEVLGYEERCIESPDISQQKIGEFYLNRFRNIPVSMPELCQTSLLLACKEVPEATTR